MKLNEREIHAGTVMAGNTNNPVTLQERDTTIWIRKECNKIEISAASARVMARNLYRLARRIEARAAGPQDNAQADAPTLNQDPNHG